MHALTKFRTDRGLTLEDFGKLVPASKAAVCKWENGHAVPRPATIKRIAKLTKGSVSVETWFKEAAK